MMKTKQIAGITLAAAVTFMSNNNYAQENEETFTQPAQITFAYPLGTNGTEAISTANNFSVNVLYGLNGGLHGTEIGGLLNYNQGDVNGFQLAGLVNVNTETTNGVMWAGKSNISLGETSGVQIAGLYNLSTGNSRGVQLAAVNNAIADFKGFQMGVVNYAHRLDGVQLGVVNIVEDGENAIPIGLINVVKNGYYAIEIVSGDVLFTNLNYKMGVEQFYTIFKMGFSSYENKPVFSTGIGFGTMVTLAERHQVSIDLSTNYIMYNEDWRDFEDWEDFEDWIEDEDWREDEKNYLTKLDVNYRLRLGDHVSLLAGPSFNLYVSEVRVDDQFGTLRIPWDAHTIAGDNKQKWMWVGFNAGLAYRF